MPMRRLPFNLRKAALHVLAVLAVVWAGGASAHSQPHRIVSVNLCADELLLRLADRADIASVTWMAGDRLGSNVADLAMAITQNHGLAEEIIPLQPDLVIAGRYTTRTAVGMLKRVAAPVVELDLPRSVDDVKAQILHVAELVGHRARGDTMVRAMDDRLAEIGPSRFGRRPTALMLNPSGFTVGAGSLVDDVLTRAGLDNIANRRDLGQYSVVPLDVLVQSDVEVLIVSASDAAGTSFATQLLKHPVITQLASSRKVVRLQSRLWNCGGPQVIDAIAQLRRVVDDLATEGRQP